MPYFKPLGLFNAYSVEEKPHPKWADGTIGGSVCIILYAKILMRT